MNTPTRLSSLARRLPRRPGLALTGLAGLSVLVALSSLAPPAQAADVGVSIAISQPGVYGRVDIGRFPQPQVIVQQPVIITRQARAPEPVYLWVPPGHQKKWGKHCGKYNACGVPVYFVQERWYHDHVMAPQPGRREGRADDRHDRRDDHGRGRGHGKRD